MDLRDYAACDAVGLAALVRIGRGVGRRGRGRRPACDRAGRPGARGHGRRAARARARGKRRRASRGRAVRHEGGRPTSRRGRSPSSVAAGPASGVTGTADTHFGQRIRAAGLRVIARTRAPEFAFNVTTEPVAHGPTRNPWDLERSVGGSSGGAAALVAARALPIAHATDGGGSIRIPASLCGIVGLKPTRSRIPVGPGLWEGLHGMAHDFVLCRTLRDAAAALDALHGPGAGDKYVIPPPARPYAEEVGAEPGRVRVRWTTDAWSGAPVAPECRAAVEATARCARRARPRRRGGHAGNRSRRAAPRARHDLGGGPGPAGGRSRARPRYTSDLPTRSRRARSPCSATGRSISAVELLDGYGDCNAIGRAIGTFFENADVLLLPSVARPPWKLGELDQNDESLDGDAWVRKLFSVYAPFTAMFNISGQPAISLPLAWSDGGPSRSACSSSGATGTRRRCSASHPSWSRSSRGRPASRPSPPAEAPVAA